MILLPHELYRAEVEARNRGWRDGQSGSRAIFIEPEVRSSYDFGYVSGSESRKAGNIADAVNKQMNDMIKKIF